MTRTSTYLKHYIKVAIGKPDPSWEMFKFEGYINAATYAKRDELLAWAENCLNEKAVHEASALYISSSDPIVRQGYELKKKIEEEFRGKYKNTGLRLLIHVPDENKSPAGYSLFTNFIEAFEFVGIPVRALGWNDSIESVLNEFKPNIFLTSDHEIFLSRIDWNAVAAYKEQHPLRLGLTAGLEEYGNTPLPGRLAWAKEHDVDFYYSYRDEEYLRSKKEYQLFYDAGYKILPLMFGANILVYYPVPNISRDIDYIFLASQNKTKASRYNTHLKTIARNYLGFIDGPGWRHTTDFRFMRDRDRYLYARSKVGINIHVDEQLQYANEVNERVYQLAACGIPQVSDDAKLLHKLYSDDAVWIAKTPEEYTKYFEVILNNPQEAERRALIAQKETFERYTTFHRVGTFIQGLTDFVC